MPEKECKFTHKWENIKKVNINFNKIYLRPSLRPLSIFPLILFKIQTMNRAIFPGSFDPITLGHVSVIKRGLPLFDELIIAIGINSGKKSMFTLEQRVKWIKEIFADEPKIKVETYEGLTVDYCRKKNAKFILRGLRTAADFEFERGIGQVNRSLAPEIETVFILTEARYTPVSSSIVRDIIKHGGDITGLVPDVVKP
jgi:pantetheine-phosphate adenylyltransferase